MSDPLMFYVPARPTSHHAVTIGYWLLAIGYRLSAIRAALAISYYRHRRQYDGAGVIGSSV
jgi:hypothetical protein